jgi:hypothetical protein
VLECEEEDGGRSTGTGRSRWAGVRGSFVCTRLWEVSVICRCRKASAVWVRARGMSQG